MAEGPSAQWSFRGKGCKLGYERPSEVQKRLVKVLLPQPTDLHLHSGVTPTPTQRTLLPGTPVSSACTEMQNHPRSRDSPKPLNNPQVVSVPSHFKPFCNLQKKGT